MTNQDYNSIGFRQVEIDEFVSKEERLGKQDLTKIGKNLKELKENPLHLEQEKEKFIQSSCMFIDNLNFVIRQTNGRPKFNIKDILKSLLIMSYNGLSYRRSQSDLRKMYQEGLLRNIPSRSVLSKYANNRNLIRILERLIQFTALFFIENENTVIIDSSWVGLRMYTGGYKRVQDKSNIGSEKCRKLHIACLKNSKVICYATTSDSKRNDCPFFKGILESVLNCGFNIEFVLADSGYSSKGNHVFCKEKGIEQVFIDFKSTATLRRAKNDLWRKRLREFRNHYYTWYKTYRYRVLVENVFSVIKRKSQNYLNSRKTNSRSVELLLKVLVYNLNIINRYL